MAKQGIKSLAPIAMTEERLHPQYYLKDMLPALFELGAHFSYVRLDNESMRMAPFNQLLNLFLIRLYTH